MYPDYATAPGSTGEHTNTSASNNNDGKTSKMTEFKITNSNPEGCNIGKDRWAHSEN